MRHTLPLITLLLTSLALYSLSLTPYSLSPTPYSLSLTLLGHARAQERSRSNTPSLAGDWDWNDGSATAMHEDGTFVMANDAGGRWRAGSRGTFVVYWGDSRVDEVHFTADENTLEGRTVQGGSHGRVSAHRRGAAPAARSSRLDTPAPTPRDCGTGLDDPGCAETRDGRVALDRDAFAGLLATLTATSSELGKRDMILAATRSAGLTARQLTELLAIFRSEVTELQVLRGVVAHVIDPQRALGYGARLRSSLDREEYVRLLTSAPSHAATPPPAPPPAPAVPSPARPENHARACPPMPACGIFCENGQAHDANGCAQCACNPPLRGAVQGH